MHEFGWKFDQWDLISAGTIAGHIIECGAQASGGNCQYDWQNIPDLANVGFPIVEASPNGEFIVTKHEGTGGRVNVQSIKEQLLYEMGDPKSYITPDVVADFSSIQLEAAGKDRVRVFGITGNPKTEFYKVSIAYSHGYKAVGTLVLRMARCLRKGTSRRKDIARSARSTWLEIRSHSIGICRRKRDAWATYRRAVIRHSRSSITFRRPRPEQSRCRKIHKGTRAFDPYRPARRHRLRWRPPESRRNNGLLSGAAS
jgi:hypothetical protein